MWGTMGKEKVIPFTAGSISDSTSPSLSEVEGDSSAFLTTKRRYSGNKGGKTQTDTQGPLRILTQEQNMGVGSPVPVWKRRNRSEIHGEEESIKEKSVLRKRKVNATEGVGVAVMERRDGVRSLTVTLQQTIRRRLQCNTTGSNECTKLELSEVREPRDSLCPLPIGDGKKIPFGFSYETKMISEKNDFLRIKLKFDHMFVVDSIGRSGGLAFLWLDDFQVDIQNFSQRHKLHHYQKRRRGSVETNGVLRISRNC